jgi:hypothetical protein
MPIFQSDLDHDHRPAADPQPIDIERPASRLRRLSEESLRTELCEGPLPDSPRRDSLPGGSPDVAGADAPTSDRAELIERLKRGQSPTWIPNRRVGTIIFEHVF